LWDCDRDRGSFFRDLIAKPWKLGPFSEPATDLAEQESFRLRPRDVEGWKAQADKIQAGWKSFYGGRANAIFYLTRSQKFAYENFSQSRLTVIW
jgi:hypothetical protein